MRNWSTPNCISASTDSKYLIQWRHLWRTRQRQKTATETARSHAVAALNPVFVYRCIKYRLHAQIAISYVSTYLNRKTSARYSVGLPTLWSWTTPRTVSPFFPQRNFFYDTIAPTRCVFVFVHRRNEWVDTYTHCADTLSYSQAAWVERVETASVPRPIASPGRPLGLGPVTVCGLRYSVVAAISRAVCSLETVAPSVCELISECQKY